MCPFVKAIEFDIYGTVTRVEFLTPADFKNAPVPVEREPDYPRKTPKVN